MRFCMAGDDVDMRAVSEIPLHQRSPGNETRYRKKDDWKRTSRRVKSRKRALQSVTVSSFSSDDVTNALSK